MDRESFFYLFVHANGLAELALDAAMAELPDAETDKTEAEEVDLATAFEDLDMDAVDGLDFFGGDSEPAESAVIEDPVPGKPEPAPPDAAPGADPDLDRYVESSYAFEEQLADRIDAAYGKADLDELTALISSLPDDLPPLTARLTGAGFGRWLALYDAEHEGLTELLLTIRRLDA